MNVDSIDLDAGLDVDLDARFHLHCNEVHHVAEAASWSRARRPAHCERTTRNARTQVVRAAGATHRVRCGEETILPLRRLSEQLKEVQIYNLKHSLQMWVGFLHQKQPVQGARARAQGEPERRGASACVSGCAGRGGLSKMRGRDVHTDDVV